MAIFVIAKETHCVPGLTCGNAIFGRQCVSVRLPVRLFHSGRRRTACASPCASPRRDAQDRPLTCGNSVRLCASLFPIQCVSDARPSSRFQCVRPSASPPSEGGRGGRRTHLVGEGDLESWVGRARRGREPVVGWSGPSGGRS